MIAKLSLQFLAKMVIISPAALLFQIVSIIFRSIQTTVYSKFIAHYLRF